MRSVFQSTPMNTPRVRGSAYEELYWAFFLTVLPFISLFLTIVITTIVSNNDTTPAGELGSGMAAAGVCMGGMVLSGIFLVVAMIYAMTRKPVNLA